MLYCQIPSIKAMDTAALTTLTACEHLSLSTNVIDKMASLGGMANLRVLSVGRNMIKKVPWVGWGGVGAHLLVVDQVRSLARSTPKRS